GYPLTAELRDQIIANILLLVWSIVVAITGRISIGNQNHSRTGGCSPEQLERFVHGWSKRRIPTYRIVLYLVLEVGTLGEIREFCRPKNLCCIFTKRDHSHRSRPQVC